MANSIRQSQPPPVVMRIETPPGEVAQVDPSASSGQVFGYIGYLIDPQTGQPRKAWAFVMVLGYSRHQYAEFVFDQSIPTWLVCHRHALRQAQGRLFEFFNGVPKRIVLDNLKAAIIKAYTRDEDPEVQQAYRECAEHYGFLIDPCLPRKPQHKGKVERGGVGYLQQAFLPLLPAEATLPQANRLARDWCLNTAGLRIHGTTRETPLSRFAETVSAKLSSQG
jgi:transposase